MPEKLIAVDGTRTYSFSLINKDPAHLTIDMYNSSYIFIKKDGQWLNYSSNKMDMAPNLIEAVIAALN